MTSASCVAPRCPLGSDDCGEAGVNGGGEIDAPDDEGESLGNEEGVGAETCARSGGDVGDCEDAGVTCKVKPAKAAAINTLSRETSATN